MSDPYIEHLREIAKKARDNHHLSREEKSELGHAMLNALRGADKIEAIIEKTSGLSQDLSAALIVVRSQEIPF